MPASRSFRAGPVRLRVVSAPKERLSTERIVDAALSLMARKGYDAVSMRSVARELDTGPASLYAHVAGREELDQLVVDRIAEEMDIPEPDPERWDEQVAEMMRQALALYRAHPGSARATMGMIPTAPGALRTAEGLMALCLAGGVPSQAAAWFCDLISLYVGAIAVEESIWIQRGSEAGGSPEDQRAMQAELTAYFAALPSGEFPVLSAFARQMTAGGGDERFEFGLTVLLAGLKELARRAWTPTEGGTAPA